MPTTRTRRRGTSDDRPLSHRKHRSRVGCRPAALLALCLALLVPGGCSSQQQDGQESAAPTSGEETWDELKDEARSLGKPEWQPMLVHLAAMHERGTHPPEPPFPYPWEEIGPGYHALAFGHWDIVHVILDVLPTLRQHARNQILNNLANQEPDGLVPGVIWVRNPRDDYEEGPNWNKKAGHPPLWPIAVDDYIALYGDDILPAAYRAGRLQLDWFEKNRRGYPEGYYYSRSSWESGLDDDFRQPYAAREDGSYWSFLDATCHVYGMYDLASLWANRLGEPDEARALEARAAELRDFIRNHLYDPESGYFYDVWSVGVPEKRTESFVGIWPLVAGAATEDQAKRVIDEHLLNPTRFFGQHPIATIARTAPEFELLTWRGPAWNSMTYWAARGCLRYGRPDAARKLLEAALDDSAGQFQRTGTIWEYYDPSGGKPEEMKREVNPPHGMPRKEYTGHNPLLAMARMYAELTE